MSGCYVAFSHHVTQMLPFFSWNKGRSCDCDSSSPGSYRFSKWRLSKSWVSACHLSRKTGVFFRMKCQMERFNSSLFVSTEMTGISCTICKNLTRVILSPTVDDFVNLALVAPVYRAQLGRFWQMVQHLFCPVFTGRFHLSQKSYPKIPCKW